ncbi:MAG: LPXTG cell wall anchor domain-containing protein [Oscillospiraceae bacterium]|nr:LPXTG cell wall anchor domain-containing protein [Oscillospiraceae bacterium]
MRISQLFSAALSAVTAITMIPSAAAFAQGPTTPLAAYTFEEVLTMDAGALEEGSARAADAYAEALDLMEKQGETRVILVTFRSGDYMKTMTLAQDGYDGEVFDMETFCAERAVPETLFESGDFFCDSMDASDGMILPCYRLVVDSEAFDAPLTEVMAKTYAWMSVYEDASNVYLDVPIGSQETTALPEVTTTAETTTAETTASAATEDETTTAGTSAPETTTTVAAGGTASPKTGDGNGIALLAGGMAALAGCLLCRKKHKDE